LEFKRIVKSDLPFGSEFSPSQVDFPTLLEIASKSADWQSFELAVKAKYFDAHATSEYNRRKLANNCKLGMIAYDIIDRNAQLTEFGKKLHSLKENEPELYRELAKHILLNKHGLALVQCISDMGVANEPIKLTTLREWLEERGVHFPRGGKHPSIMRLWLEKAGIFYEASWRINENRLQQVLGSPMSDIESLAMLSPQQRAFLKALANLDAAGPFSSNDIEKMASATYGVKFDEKNLPKQVLYPLEKAGYVQLTRGTKEPGRGAKPFLLVPTEKLKKDLLEPILSQFEKQANADLRPLLRKPLSDVLVDLKSGDRHLRGLALEALAFKIMRLIDLRYIATRLRGSETGGAEVDLIFEGLQLIFSRWQIQCKNTSRVGLDDVAKEVGLTFALKSNVVVVVSTGEIGPEARKYASHVMSTSNLDVVLMDRIDVESIKENPACITDILLREAKRAMQIKKLKLEESQPANQQHGTNT
jgi:site-specific DNA-methyltransferase (cytosine-N4-specific)